MANEKVLLVDDEINVLASLNRTLLDEDFCQVMIAQSGQKALEIIKSNPDLAVVISDYHMPLMNGIDFLVQVSGLSPDTTRMLLTGMADLEMAINAVNRGNVFRILLKPCSTDVLISNIKDGIRYNQLITAERDLLNKTLNGSIKVMIDILAVQIPSVFAQSTRLRKYAHELAILLKLDEQVWEIELAALLCQIGVVTIPHEILDKWQKAVPLNETEMDMIRSIPRMGRQLLKNIPRLEKISEAIGYQNCSFNASPVGDVPVRESIPIIARILKIIIDYDRFQEKYRTPVATFHAMQSRQSEYDSTILSIFRLKVLRFDEALSSTLSKSKIEERRVSVEDLRLGMTLSRDIFDKNGILIVAKGTSVTDVLIYKLGNYFRTQDLNTTIFIENT